MKYIKTVALVIDSLLLVQVWGGAGRDVAGRLNHRKRHDRLCQRGHHDPPPIKQELIVGSDMTDFVSEAIMTLLIKLELTCGG